MPAVLRALQCATFLFGLFFGAASLWAAGPLDRVQAATDRVIEVLSDDSLKGETHRDERMELIRGIVEDLFDWEALARGSLSTHWRDLSRDQREEFTELFGTLMERTYLGYLSEYSGEQVIYVSQEEEGSRARIVGRFISAKGREIPFEYRMMKKNGDWMIQDVLVEGVSLVRNYRAQFNDIILRSSYEDLVRRVKEKLEDGT